MEYETFRHFADSFGLVYLVILFVGIVFWTFRPSGRKASAEAAQIPLKED
ncbi:MAG: cbb3-type cytochrome c oxidase subunit 3 [Rhizobiaceae bacterium]